MADLLPAVWAALGGAPAELRRATTTGPASTLASTFPVTALGAATVAASLLAATSGTGAGVGVDTPAAGRRAAQRAVPAPRRTVARQPVRPAAGLPPHCRRVAAAARQLPVAPHGALRVLGCTRVIAGTVVTRTLATHGADARHVRLCLTRDAGFLQAQPATVPSPVPGIDPAPYLEEARGRAVVRHRGATLGQRVASAP